MLGRGMGFCLDCGGLKEEVAVRRMQRLRLFVGRGSMVLFCVNKRHRCSFGSSLCGMTCLVVAMCTEYW